MRHVTFRGVQNLEVVLPEGWWQRGGVWVGYNEVRARKCKRLLGRGGIEREHETEINNVKHTMSSRKSEARPRG